ncbi:MAG TPA: hypothetical protein VK830_03065, partial [Xanthomonadales bacterium]|nr:hypothetical protein [Xanthomonadales bacterium]
MTRLKELFIALPVLVFSLAGTGLLQAQTSASSLPIQPKERAALFPSGNSIAQGKALAEAACASCHGHEGISSDK